MNSLHRRANHSAVDVMQCEVNRVPFSCSATTPLCPSCGRCHGKATASITPMYFQTRKFKSQFKTKLRKNDTFCAKSITSTCLTIHYVIVYLLQCFAQAKKVTPNWSQQFFANLQVLNFPLIACQLFMQNSQIMTCQPMKGTLANHLLTFYVKLWCTVTPMYRRRYMQCRCVENTNACYRSWALPTSRQLSRQCSTFSIRRLGFEFEPSDYILQSFDNTVKTPLI